MILNILSVTALAILEIWAAIPLGFVLGLHPLVIVITNVIGATAGVFLIIFAGERLRNWILKRHESKKDKGEPGTIQKIWQKYGVIGLGLLSPFLTGALLGAAIGIASGASIGKLLFWMTIGIILWTVILVSLGAAGIEIFTEG
ncbi:MAG: small multi-drug export protein [Peptococcaceae bacterium]